MLKLCLIVDTFFIYLHVMILHVVLTMIEKNKNINFLE